MLRGLAGPDHLKIFPLSLFSGSVLLLGADTVTRAILPSEVPIGVITALIGGPFFCWIFRKRQMAL
jgi:iron complex transport system permease protein